MISIIAQRQPADRQGPDITDSLLTTEAAARERGRQEIDRNSTNRVLVALTGPHRRFAVPGSLVSYHGRREQWRGQVRRCAVTLSRDGEGFTADRSLEVEREP